MMSLASILTEPVGVAHYLIVGAVLRNLDDATGWLELPHQSIDNIGAVNS